MHYARRMGKGICVYEECVIHRAEYLKRELMSVSINLRKLYSINHFRFLSMHFVR